MKWLLIGGGGLVAVILVIVIVGALLPRDHVASVRARISATPDVVWPIIADVARHPTWREGVSRIELLPATDGKPTWREHSSNGVILMVTDRAEPPHRLTTRIADDKLPFGGTWDFVLEPTGHGATTVTITEHGAVYNPVFRFMSRFVFGHTATMDAYLRSLGRKFGDHIRPSVVATASSRTGGTHGP